MVGLKQNSRELIFIAVLFASSLGMEGCSLFGKHLEQTTTSTSQTQQTPQQLAQLLGPESNLARSSGQATLVRLNTLFPAGVTGSYFDVYQSTGLYKALADDTRPAGVTGQIALKDIITGANSGLPYCANYSGAMFATSTKAGPITLKSAGETLPPDCTTFPQPLPSGFPIASLDTLPASIASPTPSVSPSPGVSPSPVPTTQAQLACVQQHSISVAFAAARNTWLYPYAQTSQEVQLLAKLYRDMLAIPGNTDASGKYAVCVAAISAPQFWMGNPYKADAIRRVALEIGGTVPTMQDYDTYSIPNSKNPSNPSDRTFLKLNDYVTAMQNGPNYFNVVKSWHEDWLGLRPFKGGGMSPNDIRTSFINARSGTTMGGVSFVTEWDSTLAAQDSVKTSTTLSGFKNAFSTAFSSGNGAYMYIGGTRDIGAALTYSEHTSTAIIPTGTTPYAEYWFENDLPCDPAVTDPGSDVQTFDPRTVRVQWDVFNVNVTSANNKQGLPIVSLPNPSAWDRSHGVFYAGATASHSGAWQEVAAWVMLPPGATVPTGAYSVVDNNGATWYEETGNVTDASGVLHTTKLSDITDPNDQYPTASRFYCYTPPGTTQYNTAPSNLALYLNTPNSLGAAGAVKPGCIYEHMLRARRFAPRTAISPTGEQSGFSKVSLWHTGEPIRVCNTMSRFWATCAYRASLSAYPNKTWNAETGSSMYMANEYMEPNTMLHPTPLSNFSCGVPDLGNMSSILTPGYTYVRAKDVLAYPLGYETGYTNNLGPNAALEPVNADPVNSMAGNVQTQTFEGNYAGSPEGQAISQVPADIGQEPYLLLKDILTNSDPKRRDYRNLVTANYSFGHQALDLFYRSQGNYFNTYPAGVAPITDTTNIVMIDPTCQNSGGSKCVPYPGEAGSQPMSTALFKGVTAGFAFGSTFLYGGSAPSGMAGADASVTNMVPKKFSGILTMPAFLAPVSPAMRTLSSRYFRRLMCGMENSVNPAFVPTPTQLATQLEYMPKGPLEAAHIQPQCLQCHQNMDPLAQALSANFGIFVDQDNDGVPEGEGEMLIYYSDTTNSVASNGVNAAFFGVAQGPLPSKGAFLGQEVKGLFGDAQTPGVASVLANSPQFAHCAVQTAFQNIFGRSPTLEDQLVIDSVATQFAALGYDYNAMIRALVDTSIYQGGN